MSVNMLKRLSSDFLYNFKRDPQVLNLILRYGFRHSGWGESLPFFDIPQNSFTVCFCDIPFKDSESHRSCYGQNGIALTKEWGIRNNVSPVRYIHRSSPGATEDYIKIKTFYRSARALSPREPEKTLLHYLVHCILDDSGDLIDGDLEKTVMVDSGVRLKAQQAQTRIKNLLQASGRAGLDEEIIVLLDLLMNRIHDLHNELETRDSYMRAYREDFKNSNGEVFRDKVLYDEREWRSIKFLDLSQTLSDPAIYAKATEQGFLPQPFNLPFNDEDVVAILTADEAIKLDVQREIASGQCLIGKEAASKVFTVEKFSEQSQLP